MKLLISCVIGNNPNAIITYSNIRRLIINVDKKGFLAKSTEDRLHGLDLICQAKIGLTNKKVKVLTYQIEEN